MSTGHYGVVATHYEMLGVAPGATHDEIQRAYRQLARDNHPDTKAGAPSAAAEHAREIMATVNAAWTVLGDPARRRAYDAELQRRSSLRESPGAPEDAGADGERAGEDYAVWWDGEEEQATPGGLADQLVLVPVGLFALSVAIFAFSLMSQSGTAMAFSLILLPLAAVTFMVMPLVVMMRRARARARR
ncbi:MAG TPA: J domain-containing protein [Acidimicrobiales bacterium]|nr:J domain-containing protein [Acidimicrobiales bacterium]